MPQTRRASRDAALVELQRLHAAILASRARRGVGPDTDPAAGRPSREAIAAQELTRRLQGADAPADDAEPASRWRRGWWLAVAAAVIVAGAWAAMTLTQRREVVTEAAPSGPSAAPAAVPPREVPPAAAPAVPAKAVRVTLETIRPVWLRITIDGAPAHEGELPAGQSISAEGDREVRVRAGDAGGVRASVNGVDRGPLGRDGWPLTVPFTLDPPATAAPPRE